MASVDELLRDTVDVLTRLEIPYALIGGFAVRSHGVPRTTYDVDATVLLEREKLPRLFDAFEEIGYTVPDIYRSKWVDLVAGMPVVKVLSFDQGKSIPGDIFLAESEYQQSVIARRKRYWVEDFEADVASVEDLILLKLMASRPRDIADIADLLFLPGDFDLAYMRGWAPKLGVADHLEDALQRFA